jgi:hypothetical protein
LSATQQNCPMPILFQNPEMRPENAMRILDST